MESLEQVIGRFEGISLAETGMRAPLMKRTDSKYVLDEHLLPQLLNSCLEEYVMVDINGVRDCRYVTTYYDTQRFDFYHAHHAGKLNRIKVRIRRYVDTNTRYLEVKRRFNKGNTQKIRKMLIPEDHHPLVSLQDPEFQDVHPFLQVPLTGIVRVAYRRITLVRKNKPERVTFDFDLSFSSGGRTILFPNYTVVEVKQAVNAPSFFKELMRLNAFREGAISKYCLGVMQLYDQVRKNRFKHLMKQLNKRGYHGIHTDTEGPE